MYIFVTDINGEQSLETNDSSITRTYTDYVQLFFGIQLVYTGYNLSLHWKQGLMTNIDDLSAPMNHTCLR